MKPPATGKELERFGFLTPDALSTTAQTIKV
jgi:hypothetical protein